MSLEQPLFVGITGHRPDQLGGYEANPLQTNVIYNITHRLKELQPEYVLTGMALGVDQWTAEICMSKGIAFVAVIPFEGFDQKWPPHARARYNSIIKQAVQVITVCSPGYEGWKMQTRNRWIVDHCHRMIAVFNGTPGGTANCIAYAQQVGRPIDYIVPNPQPFVQSSDPIIVTKVIREQVVGPAPTVIRDAAVGRVLDWESDK